MLGGGSLRLGVQPPTDAVALGQRTIECLPLCLSRGYAGGSQTPLFLRIDVLFDKGRALLSECEGVEPELFFRAHPQAPLEFSAELLRRLRANLSDDRASAVR